MKALLLLLLLIPFGSHSQKRSKIKIMIINDQATPGFSKDFKIEFQDNACFKIGGDEDFNEYEVTIGEMYNIVRVGDEMNNLVGILIVDKEGYQIDFSKVQEERKANYQSYKCCVYVKEYKKKLYFYDFVDWDGNDYDCGLDSQTDGTGFKIKRYYVFNPKKNKVETVTLKTPCEELFVDGKLGCK